MAIVTAVAEMLVAVAKRRGLKAARLLHDRTTYREYVQARWELWYLLVHELGMGYAQVGRWHGYNHATVIWGVRRHAQRIAKGTAASDRGAEAKRHSDPSEAEGTDGAQPTETGRGAPVGLIGEAAGRAA